MNKLQTYTSGGNLTIGDSTSPNTFIQNSNGLIIGTDPTSYNLVNGTMSSYGMRNKFYRNCWF